MIGVVGVGCGGRTVATWNLPAVCTVDCTDHGRAFDEITESRRSVCVEATVAVKLITSVAVVDGALSGPETSPFSVNVPVMIHGGCTGLAIVGAYRVS